MNHNPLLIAAIAGLIISGNAHAHGCSGHGACSSDVTNLSPSQHQKQQQQAQVNNNTNARAWSIRPVQAPAAPAITPAATVSRFVSECGPRQQVVHKTVSGLNNRPLSAEEFEAGTDQYLISAEQPFLKITIAPGRYALMGHQVIETSSVNTVSTGGGFGFSANGNWGGGGSLGTHTSGAIQRTISTIRLSDCIMYEIDERPLKPRG